MSQTYLPMIILVAFMGAYYIWMMKKRGAAKQQAEPAWRKFFERSGYRFADMTEAPLQKQVERAMDTYGKARGAYEDCFIRDFHGEAVHWVQAARHRNKMGGSVTYVYWMIPFAEAPRVVWQVAEKTLAGAGKAIREAFSNVEREWTPVFSKPIESGDAEIDKRFRIYGEDELAVREVLQTPGLKALLLSNTEVDLMVGPERAVFNDPANKNINAAMGGTVGMMSNAFDLMKTFDLTLPVHDRMAELLATCARASR